MEAKRASNGLVKVISGKVASPGDQPPQTASSCISPLTVLGKSLSASVLQIWFPAHWAVRVAPRLRVLGGTVPEFRAEHVSSDVPNVRCGVRLPARVWMWNIFSSIFPRFFVALCVVSSASKQEVRGSLARISSSTSPSSCHNPASHIIGLLRWQDVRGPGLWNFPIPARCCAQSPCEPLPACGTDRSRHTFGAISTLTGVLVLHGSI